MNHPPGTDHAEGQFRSFFESMDQGYILADVIMDEFEVPVDLR